MATRRRDTARMPYEHSVAKTLCKVLYESGLGGLDIKTQVITNDDVVSKVIVAIPLLSDNTKAIEGLVRTVIKGDYKLIINGTGRYVAHSTIADCGTTGRKLAVDFYGGNFRLGGGSPWTKDASKADLTLNLVARQIAKLYSTANDCDVYVSLACSIGKKDVDYCIQDGNGKVLKEGVAEIDPKELRSEYLLDTPIYASMCRWGLFGEYQSDKVWENTDINIIKMKTV